MPEVVGLFGPTIRDGVVREEVVKALEAALERARSGETTGIALIEMICDGGTQAETVGTVEKRPFLGALIQIMVSEALD